MNKAEKILAAAARPTDDLEGSLYAKSQKIYPREVHGIFAAMRSLAVVVLLGLFYGLAWVSWDDKQLLLFDLPNRQFHIFGLIFFPQDFLYLTFALIFLAMLLFFVTALAGRLWCGYACPQTVWTEVFLWFERKIEGNRPKQIKLDKSSWTREKVVKKSLKQFVWIGFSLWTGFTFVGYFTPIRELSASLPTFDLGPWETFWIIFYGFATYGNAGWMREQVCLYMCPYARFQSAMFDKDTLVISYDPGRGDPRGSRKRNVDPKSRGLGDCVDCTLCVQACPTGIDIRNGLQYECIACAACIDACNVVMDKMGYDKGLIRYTTQNTVEGRPSKLMRPRTIIYALILLAVAMTFGYSMTARIPLGLDIIRDRNALYRETNEGMVENVYTLRLINMDSRDHQYDLQVTGIPGAVLDMDTSSLRAERHTVVTTIARVRADPYDLPKSSNKLLFTLSAKKDPELRRTAESRFLGPRVARQ